MTKTFRVVIADDHRLFAEALTTVLSSDDRIEVVGMATNGAEAVEQAEALEPDVILIDHDMPIVDGLTATRRIREKNLRCAVIMLTGHADAPNATRAFEAGAQAFVLKNQSIDSFLGVFLEVASLASLAFVASPTRDV
jgi:DNA-binding NarL/FixJ family response regulator